MKMNKITLCVTCAWRETCKKKYMIVSNYCNDYTEDLTLKKGDDKDAISKKHERNSGHSK